MKEAGLINELKLAKDSFATTKEELQAIKSKYESVNTSEISTNGFNREDKKRINSDDEEGRLDTEFSSEIRSLDSLKMNLRELKVDLSLLKKIISEQKELDYHQTHVMETSNNFNNVAVDKQTMLKSLQLKLNKRDIFIEKIDGFLSLLIKEEEEILTNETNKIDNAS